MICMVGVNTHLPLLVFGVLHESYTFAMSIVLVSICIVFYLWHGLWLCLIWIMFIFNLDYDNIWCCWFETEQVIIRLAAFPTFAYVLSLVNMLLFLAFHSSGEDYMVRGLEGINHDKRNDDTTKDACNPPLPLKGKRHGIWLWLAVGGELIKN